MPMNRPDELFTGPTAASQLESVTRTSESGNRHGVAGLRAV